jgi:hypothetical protein
MFLKPIRVGCIKDKEIKLDFDIFQHFFGYSASANEKQKNSSIRTLIHQLPSPKTQQNDGIFEV